MCFTPDNSAEEAARQSREIEAARQSRIQAGMGDIDSTFGQFNDDFYKQVQDNFLSLMAPDLDKQYKDTKRSLVLDLAGRGRVGSSYGVRRMGELEETRARAEADLANRALSEGQRARGDVENARGDLISLLTATGDPASAAAQANSRAALLSAPRQYDPMANAFQAITAGIGTGLAAEREGFRGMNSGLFSNNSSARTVN